MINIKTNEHGITIITLIVTVLLLVLITGTLAVNTYYSMELSSLTNLENDIKTLENRIASYYVENNALPVYDYIYTKTELQNSMLDLSVNDGENYYLIDFSKIDNITLNYEGRNFIINETSHNVYYLDGILYNRQIYHTAGKRDEILSVINSEFFTAQQISSMLGKYVDYTPQEGTYSLITGNNTYSGTADNIEDFTTEELNWRIWSIDGNTLTLIADDVTKDGGTGNGTLKLYGAVGYNNGVKIQNDICKNCYSNSEYGAVGRSLNVQDIESVLDTSEWTPEQFRLNAYGTENWYYTYDEPYQYTSNRYYPYIWQFEEYAKIVDDNKITENKKGTGINRNIQNEYYSGDKYTALRAGVSINPVNTAWTKTDFTEANFINNIYYNLLFFNGASQAITYNLASRYAAISETSNNCFFGFLRVENEDVLYNYSYGASNAATSRTYAIRPMVEINLTQVTLDITTTNGNTANAAYKLEKRV